jgi:hypothetical protein
MKRPITEVRILAWIWITFGVLLVIWFLLDQWVWAAP